MLDGEVCALDEDGTARFEALQSGSGRLILMAFDLLSVDDEPVHTRPLEERRRLLEELLDPAVEEVRVSPAFDDGDALLAAAKAQGLEGVVAKRADAPYRPGRRTPEWQKVKLRAQEDFPIVGYTRGTGRRARLGALVLGRREPDGLHWAGNVGSGLADDEVDRLRGLLGPLERATSSLVSTPKMPRVRTSDVTWVEPALSAEVTYAEKTREGRLRAPVYLGVRDDVPMERPPVEPEIRRGRRTLKLSNLDKPFWPEEGITKGELLSYYRDVAPVLVPHLRKRPFTMKRYPDGWSGKSFFQKQAPSHVPDWVETAPFPASTSDGEKRVIDYLLVDDELALLWVVNMGCIDMHAWASRADLPDKPDWVMFDLDPSEGSGFDEVIEVALLVKQTLDVLELESVPKTSGSRGIHVLVPITRRHRFDEVREAPPASRAGDVLARVDAEDAARPDVGHHLGRAGAVGRGDVRGEDAGGTVAGAGVPRGPRRCADGAPPDRAGDPARAPHAEALEPRQAVLARRGDHEGRAARVLPRRRSRARPAPAQALDLPAEIPGREWAVCAKAEITPRTPKRRARAPADRCLRY